MPSVGRPLPMRVRSASSSPFARRAAIALPAEPTPGSTVRSASRTACGSPVTDASAPSRARAAVTERVFPAL